MSQNDPLEHLTDLATFVAVVDQRGFSAAARLLGLGKAVVSKRISRLEARLGLRLLQRTTRAMSLTEAGRLLYEEAAPGLARLDSARHLAAGLAEAPRGVLRVTTSVTFGKLCLAPLLPEFLARYPDISLQLTLLDRFVDLADEGYDVALRLTREPPEHCVAKALMPIRYCLCATPAYLARHADRPLDGPADLAGHECLHYGLHQLGDTWRFARRDDSGQAAEATVRVGSRIVVNNSEVVRQLLLAGQGIGLIWRYTVAGDLQNGDLVELLPDWSPVGPFGQTAWAVWLPQPRLAPKIRAFVDFLAERLDRR